MGQAIIQFCPELLVEICKTRREPFDYLVTCEGLPADARFVRVGVPFRLHGIQEVDVVVESDELPDMAEGAELPYFKPLFRQELKVDG